MYVYIYIYIYIIHVVHIVFLNHDFNFVRDDEREGQYKICSKTCKEVQFLSGVSILSYTLDFILFCSLEIIYQSNIII